MSSPEEPAGGAGHDQPVVPPAVSEQPAYGAAYGAQQPAPASGPGVPPPAYPSAPAYPGAAGTYPPQQQAGPYPGQPGAGPAAGYATPGYATPAAPYGAPGQAYAGEPYGAQSYGGQPYGAQPYGTPYPGYPGYGQVYPRNDLAVWSLVLAVAGVALGFTLLTGIPAIILGRRARQAVARGEANNDGIAVAGVIIGWVATAIGALLVLGVLVAIVIAIATSASTRPY